MPNTVGLRTAVTCQLVLKNFNILIINTAVPVCAVWIEALLTAYEVDIIISPSQLRKQRLRRLGIVAVVTQLEGDREEREPGGSQAGKTT